jgi:tetratricopeptide (TPR) repeat protein
MRRYVALAILGSLVLMAAFFVALWLVVRESAANDGAVAADVHAHQGIVLMQQHLYHAAIEEFEAATRQSPKALDPWVGLAAVYIRLGNGPKALEGAGKAVDIARNSADAQLVLGRAHWLARNFERAETAAVEAQMLDPSNLQVAELLLHIYSDRRDDAKFKETFDRIESPTPPIQDLAVQFAVRQGEFRRAYDLRNRFERQNLEGEVLRLQLALKREPQATDIYPALIGHLVSLGRYDEAIAARSKYRGLTPLDLEMGKAYWLDGNREEAIRAYTRAAADKKHQLTAEAALAAITGDRRRWIEAFRAEWIEKDYFVLAQLEDVLKMASPLDRALIYRYAGLFDRDLLSKAATEALSVLEGEPDQFEALMTLGTAYLRLNRVDDAVGYAQHCADRHPERPEPWSLLGQLALAKQDVTTAEQHFAKAVRMEPSNPSYLYNYAWLLDQTDRDAEAVAYYERAIAASSLSFEAMNNLALIEAARGKSDRALVLLNRAVIANPQNEAAYLNRGNYYATLRLWRQALADYARALELNPLNGYAAVESARTHLELNRVDIAIEELSAALDVDPHVEDGYALLSYAYKKQGRELESAAALREAGQKEAR